jgi:hypothetical protein
MVENWAHDRARPDLILGGAALPTKNGLRSRKQAESDREELCRPLGSQRWISKFRGLAEFLT